MYYVFENNHKQLFLMNHFSAVPQTSICGSFSVSDFILSSLIPVGLRECGASWIQKFHDFNFFLNWTIWASALYYGLSSIRNKYFSVCFCSSRSSLTFFRNKKEMLNFLFRSSTLKSLRKHSTTWTFFI